MTSGGCEVDIGGGRPPLFLPSVCVHNNTRERKTSKKQGRPGSIHHMSGREVDVGGGGGGGGGQGGYSNMYVLNLKASFDHGNIWSPKLR